MKLVTYRRAEEAARLGALHDGMIVDAARLGDAVGLDFPDTMLGLIDRGPQGWRALDRALGQVGDDVALECAFPAENAALLAPIPRPRKNVIGVGLNYTAHISESARALDTADELPKEPIIFSKPTTAVAAWNDPIGHDASVTQQLDYECELGVVIGRTARRAAAEDALDYVFGYTVINDVSARDCRRQGQWIVSKGMDSFCPMGPCVVTADAIGDPHDLALKTRVNGVEKQNGNTRFMLFNVNQLIAEISKVMTLEPGDVIATGTPEGVGAGRDPQEWLWPGDVVECEIERIGCLRNPIVAA